MPKVLKDGQKRKISVSLAVNADDWEALGERCKEFQNKLISCGLDPKIAAGFSRSALVRECVNMASKPSYVNYLFDQIKDIYGIDDSQQTINFPKD